MSSIAIIPARGGSKRIPRKNIKSFLNKPIIAYSIKAAINSKLFDKIMVSTDDTEIAEIAIKYGAEVPFLRSKQNADDFATTVDVLLEVFQKYKVLGVEFQKACCIYPTAPFVTSRSLIQAFEKLKKNNFDCVFPVLKYSFPIQRALKVDRKIGRIEMFFPKFQKSRSQDLEDSYHDSGQFYFFNVEAITKKGKLWTDNTGVIEISELEGQDIDNPIDWKIAELKYKMLHEKEDFI